MRTGQHQDRPDHTGPLSGITVIEIGQYIAVPAAAQLLRDQGATVYKVEPPGGEACRNLPGFGESMFAAYNRGKHMLELDLRSDEAKASLLALVDDADVVISNLRPGALGRLGLDPNTLRQRNPALITVTLTGFGEAGQTATRPGLDIAAQAESGMMWLTGEADGDPQRVGFMVVDAATGVAIAQACSTALVHRFRTGEGADIHVSLWDVALYLQAATWMSWFQTGRAPERKGNGQPEAAPAADVIRTRTGHVVLSAYTQQAWGSLCDFLDRPDLVGDARFASSQLRATHRDALLAELDLELGRFEREDLIAQLTRRGVVIGAVRDYPSAFAARMAVDEELFIPVSGSETRFVGPPIRWDGVVGIAEHPRPLGADNSRLPPRQARARVPKHHPQASSDSVRAGRRRPTTNLSRSEN